MQRIALACATFMILASPLNAQQNPPDQSAPAPTQSQPASELPPGFVPPPPARLYDGSRGRSHRRAVEHHVAEKHHVAAKHHRAERQTRSRHRTTERHHGGSAHHEATHASKQTIRQCHSMSYKEIMRHSICRELIRQDLESAEHRRSHTSHHRGSTHRPGSKHDQGSTHKRKSKHGQISAHHHSATRHHSSTHRDR